jgi:putative SOS response-associated peptidase YedK
MCGRYTLIDLAKFTNIFPWLTPPDDARPRYNVCPTQPVAAVANQDPPRLEFFTWGLVPSWASDPRIGVRMFNARAETLAEKPAFRDAFRKRRCVILADGFYEWQPRPDGGKGKIPWHFRRRDNGPIAFAGLWDCWRKSDADKLLSCTIVTGEPNELVRPVHDRMPVIIPTDRIQEWLTPGPVDPASLQPLLKPYPAEAMERAPVTWSLGNEPATGLKGTEPPSSE